MKNYLEGKEKNDCGQTKETENKDNLTLPNFFVGIKTWEYFFTTVDVSTLRRIDNRLWELTYKIQLEWGKRSRKKQNEKPKPLDNFFH